jgi:hypothetical protein
LVSVAFRRRLERSFFRWVPHDMAALTLELPACEDVATSEVRSEIKETPSHSPNVSTLETMKFLKETFPWWFPYPSEGTESTPTHLQTGRFRYLKQEQYRNEEVCSGGEER